MNKSSRFVLRALYLVLGFQRLEELSQIGPIGQIRLIGPICPISPIGPTLTSIDQHSSVQRFCFFDRGE